MVNFVGAPALAGAEYGSYRQGTVIGAGIQVGLPLGQYDPARLINLGSNRWSFRPEIGLSHRQGRVFVELATGAWVFTRNGEYFGGTTLEQDPLYFVKGDLVYNFRRRGCWLSVNYGYASGGETTIGGVAKQDIQTNNRAGITPRPPRGPSRLAQAHLYERSLDAARRGLRLLRHLLPAHVGRARSPYSSIMTANGCTGVGRLSTRQKIALSGLAAIIRPGLPQARGSGGGPRADDGGVPARSRSKPPDAGRPGREGELVTTDQIAIGISEDVVNSLLNAALPREVVVKDRLRVRIESAVPIFRGNKAGLLFRAKASGVKMATDLGDPRARRRPRSVPLRGRQAPGPGVARALHGAESAIGDLAADVLDNVVRANLAAIQDAIPPVEIPVEIAQSIKIGGLTEGAVVKPGALPLRSP